MEKSRHVLGIIGGMGSVAGSYFLNRVVELTPAKTDQEYIETIVHNNSRIPDRTQSILHGGPSPVPELKRSVALLEQFGADHIVLACMTSHYFIPELQRATKATVLDGIQETVAHLRSQFPGVKRAGIIASTGNIKLEMFQRRLKEANIESVIMNDQEQMEHFTEPIYADWGIKAGYITGRPKDRLVEAVSILHGRGAEVIIAGCSELPLVLKQNELPVPIIDSIDVLILAAVRRCLDGSTTASTAPSVGCKSC